MITDQVVTQLLFSIKMSLEQNRPVVAYLQVEELERYLAHLGKVETKKKKIKK